ncbi:MAG: peptidoglycan-associated lipoprotein [Halothiobacillus sp. 13-55-253]|nr:MAG: peptidoglycan-associated lipoprotein [Halothiobacillus sp. 13-55-253]
MNGSGTDESVLYASAPKGAAATVYFGFDKYNVDPSYRPMLQQTVAVRDTLLADGVAPSQVDVVSYGEERPAVEGNTEAAWAKNRRADLAYGK